MPTTVGIIGAGQVVAQTHLPVLLAMPGARVQWIVDRDHRRAAALGRGLDVSVPKLPEDPGRLPDVDVVLLAVPYGARAEFYPVLARRGCAVYVEKPFARSLAEHDAWCALFAPGRLGCGFFLRSLVSTVLLREIVRSKVFGSLRSARVEFGRPGTRGGTYQSDLELAGGGMLFDVAVHALDLALHVCGSSAVKVSEVQMIKEEGFDVHTEAVADVTRGPSDPEVRLEILVSALRFTEMVNVYRFETADVGHALWGDRGLRVTPRASGVQGFTIASGRAGPTTSVQALHAHWSAFLGGLDQGKCNHASAADGRDTSALIEQLYARS
ncbi:MAG TPA: Gfo/Idh/MocA family oxidoreductase [Acidimicrobiales bacterium]|nr:Gfo/Idh/MocA family oxidoreductase [Acidimicrobiales bacterium]